MPATTHTFGESSGVCVYRDTWRSFPFHRFARFLARCISYVPTRVFPSLGAVFIHRPIFLVLPILLFSSVARHLVCRRLPLLVRLRPEIAIVEPLGSRAASCQSQIGRHGRHFAMKIRLSRHVRRHPAANWFRGMDDELVEGPFVRRTQRDREDRSKTGVHGGPREDGGRCAGRCGGTRMNEGLPDTSTGETGPRKDGGALGKSLQRLEGRPGGNLRRNGTCTTTLGLVGRGKLGGVAFSLPPQE